MKIGVIGKGIVGGAIYDGFRVVGHEVTYYDTKHPHTTIDNVLNTEIVFICVPTKENDDGSCDISIVNATVQLLVHANYQGIIAVKSTVIPGTTEKLINQYPTARICFVPEFLREKSALTDFVDLHDVLIVGTTDTSLFDIVVKCHKYIPKHTIQVTPTEAEISKYFSNVFNALRITFANGMFDVCQKLGADYQQVFRAVTYRDTIQPDYLQSSAYTKAFGGHCLPKDSQAFALLVKDLKLDYLSIFQAVIDDNEHHLINEKK